MVPFWGSYIELNKVTPKRNYFGAADYAQDATSGWVVWGEVGWSARLSAKRLIRMQGEGSGLTLTAKNLPF